MLKECLKYLNRLSKLAFFLFVWLAFPDNLSVSLDRHNIAINLSNLEKVSNKMDVGVNTNFFRSIEDYNDERVWQAMHDAGIKTIRFPGGLGNWYQWETGDIDIEGRQVFRFMKGGKNRNIPMLDMIERAKSFNMNISFVVNLTESNESLIKLVHFWKKHDAPIRWVEMGNEYYTKKFAKEIGGVRGYVRESNRVVTAMKKAGYRGKFGVSLAPESVFGNKNRAHYIKWNQMLMKMNLSLFDAVIVHYYPVAETIPELLKGVSKNFSVLMKQLRAMFPRKEVWVTEWNIGRPASKPIFNTVGHAVLDLEILSVFQREGVNFSAYHVFTGRGWELWGYKRGDVDARPQVIRRVPYFSFLQYNHAKVGDISYSFFNIKGLRGMVFWKEKGFSVLLWNVTQKYTSFSLKCNELSFKLRSAKMLKGNILARNGSLLSQVNEIESLRPVETSTLEMPPYSFGLYKFDTID